MQWTSHWLDAAGGNIEFHKSGSLQNCVRLHFIKKKKSTAQATTMPLLYANILFQLALFNHAFLF